MPFYYATSTDVYILALAVFVLSLIIQAVLKSTFAKYSKVPSTRGITAEEAVRKILSYSGIYGIRIGRVSGSLTDHYNPKADEINLSQTVYGSTSIAAIAVAAHEAGHAIQKEEGMAIYRLRQFLAPIASFCSSAGVYVAFGGFILAAAAEHGGDFGYKIMTLGIALYFISVLFYLVMVPVEYNASNRALKIIKELGLVGDDQMRACKKVLRAAGRTYVIALASSAVTLLRLISMRNNRSRRR